MSWSIAGVEVGGFDLCVSIPFIFFLSTHTQTPQPCFLLLLKREEGTQLIVYQVQFSFFANVTSDWCMNFTTFLIDKGLIRRIDLEINGNDDNFIVNLILVLRSGMQSKWIMCQINFTEVGWKNSHSACYS